MAAMIAGRLLVSCPEHDEQGCWPDLEYQTFCHGQGCDEQVASKADMCGVASTTCCCLQVSKAVFASTTKSQLNLNNQRANESNPTLTYPDISFAVENFEEAFESLVSLPKAAPLWSRRDCN